MSALERLPRARTSCSSYESWECFARSVRYFSKASCAFPHFSASQSEELRTSSSSWLSESPRDSSVDMFPPRAVGRECPCVGLSGRDNALLWAICQLFPHNLLTFSDNTIHLVYAPSHTQSTQRDWPFRQGVRSASR